MRGEERPPNSTGDTEQSQTGYQHELPQFALLSSPQQSSVCRPNNPLANNQTTRHDHRISRQQAKCYKNCPICEKTKIPARHDAFFRQSADTKLCQELITKLVFQGWGRICEGDSEAAGGHKPAATVLSRGFSKCGRRNGAGSKQQCHYSNWARKSAKAWRNSDSSSLTPCSSCSRAAKRSFSARTLMVASSGRAVPAEATTGSTTSPERRWA